MEIKSYVPNAEIDSLVKFLKKSQKHIEGLLYTVGKMEKVIFSHFVKTDDGSGIEKYFHEVNMVTITLPDVKEWSLISTIYHSEGVVVHTDKKNEVIYSNPLHGLTYKKCDVCHHGVSVLSYVIRNMQTGEELQVGKECIKKFGVGGIIDISKFVSSLYATYDFTCDCGDGEENIWKFSYSDHSAIALVSMKDAFGAAKKYYDDNNGKWISGYYDNEHYYPSKSNENLQYSCRSKEGKCDDEYIKKVIDFVKEIPEDFDNEFQTDMKEYVSDNFYIPLSYVYYAFFAIKKYEHSIKPEMELSLKVGDQIMVKGKVIEHKTDEGIYGTVHHYKIDMGNGLIGRRTGKIPVGEDKSTEFYSVIKFIDKKEGILYLDRVTKNPKKGIAIKEY